MPAILLVDDDLNLLSGLRRVLREQPYDLFTANSTEMACVMFQRQPFDLVVADQEMSGKSGLELIKWLADAFPDTIRIMLTGRANVEVTRQAINEGKVFRFLTKPCHDVELALAIREGLEVFCLSWTLSEFDELEYSSPPGVHDVAAQAIFPRAENINRSSPLAGECTSIGSV